MMEPLISQFIKISSAYKDKAAIESDSYQITYSQLDQYTNQIANLLNDQHLHTNRRAVVALGRSHYWPIIFLALLKANATYIPLSTEWPKSRVKLVTNDAKPDIIINDNNIISIFEQSKAYSNDPPLKQKKKNNVAYIIYTSGSTGKTKGVQISYTSLYSFLLAITPKIKITANDRWLAITSLIFDISVLELLCPLLIGSTLIIADKASTKDPIKLVDLLFSSRASIMQATPVTWQMLNLVNWTPPSKFKALCGGEAISLSFAKELASKTNTFYHLYGPTEATIWATLQTFTKKTKKVTLGTPLSHITLGLFQEKKEVHKAEKIGMICLSGPGTTLGYLNQKKLTAEAFFTYKSKKYYRTGDLAKYNASGELIFIGREDSQVKINGHRVELAEIENTLNICPLVFQNTVLSYKKELNTRLCAFILLNKKQKSVSNLQKVLKAWLLHRLPAYMIPEYIFPVETLPRLENGKIDRQALIKFLEKNSLDNKVNKISAQSKLKKLLAENIGLYQNEDLYALNISSLSGIKILVAIKKEFGVDVDLSSLFDAKDFNHLFKIIMNNMNNMNNSKRKNLSYLPKNNKNLSAFQSQIYAANYLLPKKSTSYNLPFGLELQGHVDFHRLKDALLLCVKKHRNLQKIFVMDNKKPTFKILTIKDILVERTDLTTFDDSENNARAEKIIHAFITKPFDFDKSIPVRFLLIKLNKKRHFLVTVFHHIISDNWTLSIYTKDLFRFYMGEEKKTFQKNGYLPYLTKGQLNFLEKEWAIKLKNHVCPLTLHDRNSISVNPNHKSRTILKDISKKNQKLLYSFSSKNKITAYTICVSALQILFYRFSNKSNFTIGMPFTLRKEEKLLSTIDCLTNTLPVVLKLNETENFLEIALQMQKELTALWNISNIPLQNILASQKSHKISNNLFNIVIADEVVPNTESSNNLNFVPFFISNEYAKYDLVIYVLNDAKKLRIAFEYSEEKFYDSYIENLAQYFVLLLEKLISSSSDSISKILISTENKKYNNFYSKIAYSAINYPRNATVPEAFSSSVRAFPDNIALTDGESAYTYIELDYLTTKIANYLLPYISKNSRIAIIMPRDTSALILFLAVLKAGGVYCYIQPDLPKNRINFLVRDLTPDIIISDKKINFLPESKKTILWDHIKADTKKVLTKALPSHITPLDPGYIIYTSGTTGTPNGVVANHRNIVRLVKNTNYLHPSPTDIWAQISTLSFDACILEIWGAWLNGATLFLISEEARFDIEKLRNILEKNSITKMFLTTDYFDQLVKTNSEIFSYNNDLEIFIGGSQANKISVNQVLSNKNKPKRIINFYGPTETSCGVTTFSLNAPYQGDRLPIGRPMSSVKIFIIDKYNRIVPPGIAGEICISGDAVTLGYWQREELTRKKFILSPFQEKELMYKTGDVGRYDQDGNIEFLSRIDDQIKWKGIRIEPFEIVRVINKVPFVEESAVFFDTQASPTRLIAFIKLKNEQSDWKSQLKLQLEENLPLYMLPAMYIEVKNIRLNKNGKIDKDYLLSLLSSKEKSRLTRKVSYSDEVEDKNQTDRIIQIWGKILNHKNFSIQDNFFDVGGNSLLLITLLSQLNREFKLTLTAVDLFKYPNIESLKKFIFMRNIQKTHSNKKIFKPLTKKIDISKKIAIICVDGKFPQADNIDIFWEKLCAGENMIAAKKHEELIKMGVSEDSLNNNHFVPRSGFIDDLAAFDAALFSYTAKQAASLDPHHRLFLETLWRAFEKSGYWPNFYSGKIGIYSGMSHSEYAQEEQAIKRSTHPRHYFENLINKDKGFLATRSAYHFNLSGPAVNVDTGCSTGLVCLAHACQALRDLKCDMAIAGAVSLLMPHQFGYCYEKNYIYSHDGKCRSFDEKANGTVPGSAVTIVICKRLEDAIRDNDKILATIDGFSINNDGQKKLNYMAPSVSGQVNCILDALNDAKVSSEKISYLEAHGTATKLGDQVELSAISQTYYSKNRRLQLGSVKSNIGHTDSAAGLAGIIKLVMMLEHKIIPKNSYFRRFPKECINLQDGFLVSTKTKKWEKNRNQKLYCAVSAFGIGGTNAHFILSKDYSKIPCKKRPAPKLPFLIILSARSDAALSIYKERLKDFLSNNRNKITLSSLAFTLQYGKKHLTSRFAAICSTITEVLTALDNTGPHILKQTDSQLSILAKKWLSGEEVNFDALYAEELPSRIELPTYPFEKENYWSKDDLSYKYYNSKKNREDNKEAVNIDTENTLKAMWKKILGISLIGPHDNFYNLGGDSMSSLELAEMIEKQFAIEVSADAIMTYDTIVKQSKLIEIEHKKFNKKMLIPFQITNDKLSSTPIIIFIHPVGGTAFCFKPLLSVLPTDIDAYAFQDPLLSGEFKFYTNYQGLISRYLKELSKIPISNRPLIFVGYSAGGTISVELIRALQKKNIKIKHLIMFDTWSSVVNNITNKNAFLSIIDRQLDILKFNTLTAFRENEKMWRKILWNRMELMLKYTPEYLDIDVTLFKACDLCDEYAILERYHCEEAKINGWRNYFPNISVVNLPFAHEKIFSPNNIKITATKFREKILLLLGNEEKVI